MAAKTTADWRDALASLAGATDAGASDHTSAVEDTSGHDAPKAADTVTIFYERKGRGGKQATIVSGFTCSDTELKAVASELKQRLATGGSARGGEILIQGDRRSDTAAALKAMGYKVKGDTGK